MVVFLLSLAFQLRICVHMFSVTVSNLSILSISPSGAKGLGELKGVASLMNRVNPWNLYVDKYFEQKMKILVASWKMQEKLPNPQKHKQYFSAVLNFQSG